MTELSDKPRPPHNEIREALRDLKTTFETLTNEKENNLIALQQPLRRRLQTVLWAVLGGIVLGGGGLLGMGFWITSSVAAAQGSAAQDTPPKNAPLSREVIREELRKVLLNWKPQFHEMLYDKIQRLQEKVNEAGVKSGEATATTKELGGRLRKLETDLPRALATFADKTAAEVQKVLGEVDFSSKLGAVQRDQANQGRQLSSLQGKLDAYQADQGRRVGAIEDGVKALQAGQKQQAERAALLESEVQRLREALQIPADDQLASVLFLLDGGQRMLDYRYEDARTALLEAVEAAVRQTPRREFGLLSQRGKEAVFHLKMGRHYAPDLVAFRQKIEDLNPVRSEDTDWQSACERGIGLLATREGKKQRLVYVTCQPLAPAPLASGRLAEEALKRNIEVWVVQLVGGPNDAPAKELSYLATETGGLFLTVHAGREGAAAARRALAARRLTATLFQALDLRPPAETAGK